MNELKHKALRITNKSCISITINPSYPQNISFLDILWSSYLIHGNVGNPSGFIQSFIGPISYAQLIRFNPKIEMALRFLFPLSKEPSKTDQTRKDIISVEEITVSIPRQRFNFSIYYFYLYVVCFHENFPSGQSQICQVLVSQETLITTIHLSCT